MIQKRFKSKVLWVGIATQIVLVLLNLGIIDVGASEILNKSVTIICELLVTFGILNNPTASDRF